MRVLPLMLCLLVFVGVTASPVVAASPELTVTSPTNNDLVTGGDVTVRFEAKNFQIVPSTVALADYGKRPDLNKANEGHLHITLDLNPLVVWDQNNPYTFNRVPAGEHQLTVEMVNNDHSSLIPPIVRTVRFNTAPTGTTAPTTMPATGSDSTMLVWIVGMCLLAAGLGVRASTRR